MDRKKHCILKFKHRQRNIMICMLACISFILSVNITILADSSAITQEDKDRAGIENTRYIEGGVLQERVVRGTKSTYAINTENAETQTYLEYNNISSDHVTDHRIASSGTITDSDMKQTVRDAGYEWNDVVNSFMDQYGNTIIKMKNGQTISIDNNTNISETSPNTPTNTAQAVLTQILKSDDGSASSKYKAGSLGSDTELRTNGSENQHDSSTQENDNGSTRYLYTGGTDGEGNVIGSTGYGNTTDRRGMAGDDLFVELYQNWSDRKSETDEMVHINDDGSLDFSFRDLIPKSDDAGGPVVTGTVSTKIRYYIPEEGGLRESQESDGYAVDLTRNDVEYYFGGVPIKVERDDKGQVTEIYAHMNGNRDTAADYGITNLSPYGAWYKLSEAEITGEANASLWSYKDKGGTLHTAFGNITHQEKDQQLDFLEESQTKLLQAHRQAAIDGTLHNEWDSMTENPNNEETVYSAEYSVAPKSHVELGMTDGYWKEVVETVPIIMSNPKAEGDPIDQSGQNIKQGAVKLLKMEDIDPRQIYFTNIKDLEEFFDQLNKKLLDEEGKYGKNGTDGMSKLETSLNNLKRQLEKDGRVSWEDVRREIWGDNPPYNPILDRNNPDKDKNTRGTGSGSQDRQSGESDDEYADRILSAEEWFRNMPEELQNKIKEEFKRRMNQGDYVSNILEDCANFDIEEVTQAVDATGETLSEKTLSDNMEIQIRDMGTNQTDILHTENKQNAFAVLWEKLGSYEMNAWLQKQKTVKASSVTTKTQYTVKDSKTGEVLFTAESYDRYQLDTPQTIVIPEFAHVTSARVLVHDLSHLAPDEYRSGVQRVE